MNRVLVIGGTGTVGRQVVSGLAAMGAQVRALARNPGAVRLPPQVEAVQGDLTLPETLDRPLSGVDKVTLCGRRRQPLWLLPWSGLRSTHGALCFSQLRSKQRIRSSNSPIRSERWSSKSSG